MNIRRTYILYVALSTVTMAFVLLGWHLWPSHLVVHDMLSATQTDLVSMPKAELQEPQFPYTNQQYHFYLSYPARLRMHSYGGGEGSFTVVFQDTETQKGFQIFVTPYEHSYIDDQRFKKDNPSGVFKNQTDIIIDGERATMFYGIDPVMGETREVWFIHDGFLYEVTTYKTSDDWLAKIMKSWRFI